MAALGTLRFARPVYRPISRVGLVDSEGDIAINADDARRLQGVNGRGITVGVISDSYNLSGDGAAATDIQTADLPGLGVDPLIESVIAQADEGRAMLQIVHDVAPGASLSFGHTDTPAEQAQNIRNLAFGSATGGIGGATAAEVIVDDIGWATEPFFQDGIVAQAVDRVVAAGVAYFAAAGNDGARSYQSEFRDSGIASPAPPKPIPGDNNIPINAIGTLHDFAADSAVDAYQEFTLPVGASLTVSFQWDEPFGSLGGAGSTSDLDVLVVGADERTLLASQIDLNVGRDAVEFFTFTNNGGYDLDGIAGADETFNLALSLLVGSAPA